MNDPHLSGLLTDLDDLGTRTKQLFAEHTEAQLCWKPEPGVWSMVQCIEHLVITNGLYLPRLQSAVERLRREERKTRGPYRPSWFARWFIDQLRPETTRKVKTLQLFRPDETEQDPAVLDRFLEQQDRLRDLLREADGYDLNGPRFSSPATRLVRFTPGEGLTMLIVHEQRHVRQAERLAGNPSFPGSVGSSSD